MDGEQRPGQEPEHAPVDSLVEFRDAQGLLVALQQGHGLGAGEQVLGDDNLGAGGDGAGLAGEIGLEDVEASSLRIPEDGVDVFRGRGDQRRQPVDVGYAGPGVGGVEADRLGVLLRQVAVLELPGAIGQVADDAFMDDLFLADVGRNALALDRAVGRQGDGNGAGVGHGVRNREHVVRIHLDPAREGQAGGRDVAEHHRVAGRQGVPLGQGPDGRGCRQARHVLTDPAEIHEPRKRNALRFEELDRRRILVGSFAELQKEQIIHPRAAQGD